MNDNESEDTINAADLDPRTTPLYKTSPERIGLAIGCRGVDLWQTDFNGCKDVTWYTGEPPVSVTIGYVRADLYDALQSQLAAANERADGLQRIVDEARAQKPVCITTLDDFCTVVAYPPPNVLHSVPLYAAAHVPAQPAEPHYLPPVCGYCERPFDDRDICQVCTSGIEPAQPAVVPEGWVLELLAEANEYIDAPERNCSCHISPPCSDCIDYAHVRDIKERITAILSTTDTGTEVKK